MVHVIVDFELLVKILSTIAFILSEFGCLVFVNTLDDVFWNGVLLHLHVICDDIGLCPKVLSFEAPADLTWNPGLEVYDCTFVIERFL